MSESDQIYREVSESIKLVFDLTSRIDERVKILVEQHNEATQKIEKIAERHENLLSRISVLENKNGKDFRLDMVDMKRDLRELEINVSALKVHSTGYENKWRTAFDFLFKFALTVIGAILAWKLGK